MTTEELKAHRHTICAALIEGKQCQVIGQYKVSEWFSCDATTVAHWLFDSDDTAARVRIKPEPRKVWIGWHAAGQCLVPNEHGKSSYEKQWGKVNWQLVEEPE